MVGVGEMGMEGRGGGVEGRGSISQRQTKRLHELRERHGGNVSGLAFDETGIVIVISAPNAK